MPFRIIRNDITKVKADVIVNTANPRPVIGGGTDTAVYNAAGKEQLLAQRRAIGDIAPGGAAFTDAFSLNAKYIIHTVGPSWEGGNKGERRILHSCYEKSLALAEKLKARSIAFPMIATGTYGFPKDEALNIALSEIGKFLLVHEMDVTLVVFDRKALELSEEIAGEIEQFIDDSAHRDLVLSEYNKEDLRRNRRYSSNGSASVSLWETRDLDQLLGSTSETFQQKLLKLIDERGLDDVTVYKRANISKQVFSKIRSNPAYRPSKRTAFALSIALQLSVPEMVDLLSRAEIALSPSSDFDRIVIYFIEKKRYDIFEIDAALFKYGQPTIGNYE